MVKLCDMNEPDFGDWVATRPPAIQALIRRLPPNQLYRLKTSGHRVTIAAYSEDGTVRVNVSGEYNLVAFERSVFGIKPEDLEEADLPSAGEPLGSAGLDPHDVVAAMKQEGGHA